MAKKSAGILLYRRTSGQLQVLLVHPGGPFWKNKDVGAWSIPKGGIETGEDPETAARREFAEEVGHAAPLKLVELGSIKMKSGKHVQAWAGEGDVDPVTAKSITATMEWPPRSGRSIEFQEIDRVEWFDIPTARTKINAAQAALVDKLLAVL